MSVPTDTCSECCSCPAATVEWDSVSASRTKVGWAENAGYVSTPPKRYFKLTRTLRYEKHWEPDSFFYQNALGDLFEVSITGGAAIAGCVSTHVYSDVTGLLTHTQTSITSDTPVKVGEMRSGLCPGVFGDWYDRFAAVDSPECLGIVTPDSPSGPFRPAVVSAILRDSSFDNSVFWETDGYGTLLEVCDTGYGGGGNAAPGRDVFVYRFELSDEYTTALLKSNTVAALPAYDADWNDTEGSYADTSTNELTYAIRESRYRLRFKIPQVRTGKLYRVGWVERFIPEAGVGVTAVDVFSPGVYRPAVSFSGGGGSGAQAVAVMSASGGVSAIRILNPGSGYTSAPTVTLSAAINGGTTATATATIANGQIATIAVGTAGNYLPQLAFSAPPAPGATATATCTMDAQGGIASVSLGAAGSGYTSAPTLTVTSRTSGATTIADLLLRLGTETPRCGVWDGSTLAGRWFTRAVLDAGHALSSIEVVHGGNYLPTVAINGGGGNGAKAIVSGFSSDGKVTAITVTDAGAGYTSAPTVTITGRGGGSGATATASISGGSVSGITVGAQGNYLPTLTISGGGGAGAAATVALNTSGAISAITLTAPGSGYLTNPTLTLSYYGTETILLAAHFGTETEYSDGAQPPGALPVGYVGGVVHTYPILGDTGTAPWRYYELPVPSADGTTLVANVRAVCDGTACP